MNSAWDPWAYWLRLDPEQYKEWVWEELLGLLGKARRIAMSGYEFHELRRLLFVPFDTQWNRRVSLLVSEIELAQDRIYGEEVDEREDFLHRQWTLSGLSRP